MREEQQRNRRKLFKNHFRLRRDSREAREKVQKMTRKERKKLQKEYERLSNLSMRELQAHMMLKDPDNKFMRKITIEGSEGLHELQKADLWGSIMAKKQVYHENTNDFLNSLTDDEFTEFIQARDIPIGKLSDTGRASEVSGWDVRKENMIDMKE